MSTRPRLVATLLCLAAVLSLGSCASGPPPVRMGTAEWYWSAAKEQFAAGDFIKTQEHLDKVVAGEGPFQQRAAMWNLVVMGGLARGYRDLAEAYDSGGTSTKSQSAAFHRTAMDMQRYSRQYSIGLAEQIGPFLKSTAGSQQFALEFAFPSGSPSEVSALAFIRKGTLPPEGDRLSAERQTLARGVLLETAAVVGAGEDAAKAAEMFKASPIQVPRAVFLCGLAEAVVRQSAIFDRKKLNEPDKKKILLQLASDCIAPAAESSDAALKKKAKDVQAKIEKEQKALGKA